MYNANKPTPEELPSAGRLFRSTLLAMVAAAALLVTMVLPSEYGIDPTGAGRLLGLAEMGEIKMQLAAEAEADRRLAAETQASPSVPERAQTKSQGETEAPATAEAARPAEAVTASEPEGRSDEISITLSPGEGTEIKLVMQEGAEARFEWTANGGLLNYDTHGDGGGQSISYEKGRAVPEDAGVLVAAFDGNHGWFWRNRTEGDVTLTLRTRGAYRELKRLL